VLPPWPRRRKRPMRMTTMMPVIAPKVTKARLHVRNRVVSPSLWGGLPELVLWWSASSPLAMVIT
jgi:hypothetical protein